MEKKQTKSDTLKKGQDEVKELSLRKKGLIANLEKTLGVVTTACRNTGVHRSTFYEWYNTDNEFKDQVDDLKNVALDFAESQLHSQIKDGSTAATIFFLKTQGKGRGYIERIETENLNPMEPIEVHIIDPENEAQDENQSE